MKITVTPDIPNIQKKKGQNEYQKPQNKKRSEDESFNVYLKRALEKQGVNDVK